MLVDAAKQGDIEIPYFCYEPKLGAPVGACRMCLVEIEGIPKLQTSCSTPVKDGMVVHTQTDRVHQCPERDRRVPARQPPARLPGVRQGRRVPAPGHHVRLGARALAVHRAQAPLREAAGAVAADRDRPRAVHPLLPVRALLAGDLRGLPADLHRARRPHVRGHVRRPSVRGAVQRQHHRAVPGRRVDVAAVPLPRAAVGHRGRRRDLHAVPVAVQRRVHGPRREGRCGSGAATPPARPRRRSRGQSGRRRRLAVRQGPVRLPGDPRRRADHAAAGARRRQLRAVSWDRALDAAAGLARHQGRGRRARRRSGHQRGGVPDRAADARGAPVLGHRLARRSSAARRISCARWPRRRSRPPWSTSSSRTPS